MERGTLLGTIREPGMYEDSVVIRVDAGPHPWADNEMPVPRKYARTKIGTGDRVRLVWPDDARRGWPDIYRIEPS